MFFLSLNVDSLFGDLSDDTFVATAPTLGAPDIADGGSGTDVLSLQGGGSFDFTGVTLTDIEGIETDGSTTTMIFTDAATALLVAAKDSSCGASRRHSSTRATSSASLTSRCCSP